MVHVGLCTMCSLLTNRTHTVSHPWPAMPCEAHDEAKQTGTYMLPGMHACADIGGEMHVGRCWASPLSHQERTLSELCLQLSAGRSGLQTPKPAHKKTHASMWKCAPGLARSCVVHTSMRRASQGGTEEQCDGSLGDKAPWRASANAWHDFFHSSDIWFVQTEAEYGADGDADACARLQAYFDSISLRPCHLMMHALGSAGAIFASRSFIDQLCS